jgi:hypothetical protein
MSAHVWWTLACDFRLTERCLTLRGTVPPGAARAADLRALALTLDWHYTADGQDVCPSCWPDRPRYYKGRLVSGIPIP